MMVSDKVIALVANQFGLDESEVTEDTQFTDLGADSLDIVELIMAFEAEFDIKIEDDDVENIVTVGDAISCISDVI